VILIDNIFDNKNIKPNFQKYIIANICQEETIKILSRLFGESSDFWKTWNIRKLEYSKAYMLDKTIKTIDDYSEFEKIADYKSAFGKIAIDSLYYLTQKKDPNTYKTLLKSHKFFYTSFQILDDIMDYKEDSENGQLNISRSELTKYLAVKNESIEDYTVEEQKKLIYLRGIASNLYNKAVNYINEALEILPTSIAINSLWENELKRLHNTGITHLLNINGFLDVYNSKKELKYNLMKTVKLSNAIICSENYVINKQQLNGNWNDFFSDAGISDIWVTSYIIFSLSKLKTSATPSVFVEARKFIKNNNLLNGLWGYNKMWIDDADSSSFALLALKNFELNDCLLKKWFEYQNSDGGFRTYSNKNDLLSSLNSPIIKNVDGWLQSHFCVSAVAYLVFIELKITNKKKFKHLREYLINNLESEDETLSYWWAEDIYAIYYILSGAVLFKDTQILKLCEKKVERLIEQDVSNNYFKGLLLSTLCLTDFMFDKFNKNAIKLYYDIINNQYSDGSWNESYSLRIPHPSTLSIHNRINIWSKANKGTNILVKDHNRFFTTISCLTALNLYEKRIS